MATALPRQPGQKEGRYAHLLSGEPDIPVASTQAAAPRPSTGLENRVDELELELEVLRDKLAAIETRLGDKE